MYSCTCITLTIKCILACVRECKCMSQCHGGQRTAAGASLLLPYGSRDQTQVSDLVTSAFPCYAISMTLCKAAWNNMMLFYPELKFKIIYLNLFLFYVYGNFAYMYEVLHNAWCPQRLKEGTGSPGARVIDDHETKSRSLGRAVSMSITEPSLSPVPVRKIQHNTKKLLAWEKVCLKTK